MNFAIIGVGNIAQLHIEAIRNIPGASIAVFCNPNETHHIRALTAEWSADWIPDYKDVMRRSDVDIVNICTPSGLHSDIAIEAAQHGKHVIVEKPLEITLTRIDRVLQAAQEQGIKLTCILPMRFSEGVAQVKKALEANRLGRLTLIDTFVKWFRTTDYYARDWRGTWSLDGGGALMNQSIHHIDLLQWLGGPVSTIFGQTATLVHEIETEDTASAVLQFENGALGVIQGATSTWPGEPARLEIRGNRGTIALQEGRIVTWKLLDSNSDEEAHMLNLDTVGGSGSQDPMSISYDRHLRQIADMVEAIKTDGEPLVSGSEARKSVEIIRAIYYSARHNRGVTLPFGEDADDRPAVSG